MESIQKNNKIRLELSNEEALVLLSWLSRFNETDNTSFFEDQAEERVLWDIEAVIEKGHGKIECLMAGSWVTWSKRC